MRSTPTKEERIAKVIRENSRQVKTQVTPNKPAEVSKTQAMK